MVHRAARYLAGLFLLLSAPAAMAVPIEVVFTSNDRSVTGTFAFERRQPQNNPGTLTSGSIEVAGRTIDGSQLLYEYYPNADSLLVRIFGDQSTGLEAGDFLSLSFSNPDGATLDLPTRGQLGYSFGGNSGSLSGTITAVPEPLAVGLFGLGAAGLAWRRRRRGGLSAVAA